MTGVTQEPDQQLSMTTAVVVLVFAVFFGGIYVLGHVAHDAWRGHESHVPPWVFWTAAAAVGLIVLVVCAMLFDAVMWVLVVAAGMGAIYVVLKLPGWFGWDSGQFHLGILGLIIVWKLLDIDARLKRIERHQ